MTKFRKIKEGGIVADWVDELAGVSGVYIIKEDTIAGHAFGSVLYVGESHTNRLRGTVLRHFQRWKGKTAGPTYDPGDVVVAFMVTDADKAVEMQNDAIGSLTPRDNVKENPLST